MGSCASANAVQSRNDLLVKKVKVSNVRLKQREETRRLRQAGMVRPMIGEERNTDLELDTYAKQIHLMPRTQRNVTAFFGTLSFADSSKIFQPMLKNLVLDNQESFPKWLYLDEQFRNDQMQDFLSKCQETAKLQSQDAENDNITNQDINTNTNSRQPTQNLIRESSNRSNNNNYYSDDDEEEEDDDDYSSDPAAAAGSSATKLKKSQNQAAGGMLTSIGRPSKESKLQIKKANYQLSTQQRNSDSNNQINSDDEDETEGLISKGVTKNNRGEVKSPTSQPTLPIPISKMNPNQQRGSAATGDQQPPLRKIFTKTRSIYEEKSQLSKRSQLDDDDGNPNSHSEDSDEDQQKDMRKFQELSGLKSSMNQNNFFTGSSRKHSRIESLDQNAGAVGASGASESEVGGAGAASKHMQASRSSVPSLKVIQPEGITRQPKHRTSNGTNHYIIKEFVIVRNTWIHTAICCAAIKTPSNLLEFKRRYFYEFDKMSAFLSQLLALKRMNFPNLLTFSYIQIGEASYTGDLQQVRKRMEQEEAMMLQSSSSQVPQSPSSNTLGIKDMPMNMRKSKRGNTLQVYQQNGLVNGLGNGQPPSNTNLSNNAGSFPGTIQESLRDMNVSEMDDEDDSRLIMYIDRIFPECGKSLEEFIHHTAMNPVEDMLKICTQGFKVFYSIANTLCKMHRAGFSYRVLRPSMIRIVQTQREMNVFLDSPDYIWDSVENTYLTKLVKSETDFMNYDCKCLSAIMIYFFLTIQETRHNSMTKSSRIGGAGGAGGNANSAGQNAAGQPQQQSLYDTLLKPNYVGIASSVTSLKLIGVTQPHAMSFAEIVTIEDAVELDSLLSRLKLPQVVIETIKDLIVPELKTQKPIEEFAVRLLGVLEKGPQTAFKHDSLSAYLSFHGQRTLKNENMHVYFRRKNQVHFYEFESKTFKVIKLMRKKAKFPVRTHMTFSHYDNCFYFFAAQNSNKVVKFPLNTNSKQRHVINQKSEVIFFKSIKSMQIEEPQILTVIPDELSFSLYVFNNKSNTDLQTNDVFYNSFIVNVEYKQNDQNKDDWKENIQIYEGPRNYQWRRRSFHFFDPHNKFIYCILDSLNIFERGIRYSYFDTSVQKGDFKDGSLRFACSTEEVFEEFCELNMHIDSMEFCVEVQHGVFLLQASKNIYVLDFNYKCFYSFSTLKQLKEFESNRAKHPHRHAYAYEILNQPFEVKLNTALNLGKNVVFQEGMLHILGRKEIETVICSYELLPTQGVMVLKKCFSLHSFDDILLKIPRPLIEIWNFQEFKRVILERASNPFVFINRTAQFNSNNTNTSALNTQNTDTLNNASTFAFNNSTTMGTSGNRQVPAIKVSGTMNDNIGSAIFNTSTLKPSVTVLPAPPSSNNNADKSGQKFKTAATKGQDTESEAAMNSVEQSRGSGTISKQDEQKLQLFTTKLNLLNGSPSNLNGVTEGLDELTGYHDNQFKLLGIFQHNKDFTLYRIIHHSNPCNIRKASINSIAQYEQYIQLLEMNAQSKYLMQIKQCFLTQDDETGQLNINLIEDDCEWSLSDELRRRKMDTSYFRAPEVGQLLKAIFKGVLALQSIELVHGNVQSSLVYFTSKGCIRLAGWYLDNHESFENDFLDACSLIYSIATLEIDSNNTSNPGEGDFFRLTLPLLQSRQEHLKMYPGLYSFLHNNLLILQDGENLDLEKTEEDVRNVYQNLQVSTLKLNRDSLSSVNRHIFWVGYGGNYIISSHHKDLTFCKNEVVFHNNLPYKFSKYNMFTFDGESTMYMSGAVKEEFKTPTQLFYSIDFNFIHTAKVKLRQLKDIPNSILQPSLMYCNEYVYCVGGYMIKFDGSKSISKKAYRYSIKSEEWEQLSDMPVGVVSGTLLTGKENKVLYLFGGVSEEVDLRGRELNYIVYDIDFDEWNLKVDLSMKSPFVNNRYVKPLIDHIGNNIFVSMQRTSDAIYIQFFELQRGGLNIKFKIEDEKDDLIKEQNAEVDVFNDINYRDYFKTYQDDLSLIFVNDTVYILDEFSNALLVINFANFNNIKYDRTPCGLIASIQKSSQLDRNLSYDHDTSVDSFFFNGY